MTPTTQGQVQFGQILGHGPAWTSRGKQLVVAMVLDGALALGDGGFALTKKLWITIDILHQHGAHTHTEKEG